MIAKLTGILDSSGDGSAVIDVSGVGYLIFASSRTLSALGGPGASVSVQVETHVREDHIHLYGFADRAEKACFQLLQTVQGVGAKAALSILSALSAGEVYQAIAAQDRAMLTRADGVGPKLATRVVNELKDKAISLSLEGAPAAVTETARGNGSNSGAGAGGSVQDAVSALVNLGYGRAEAFGAVTDAAKLLGEVASVEQLITAGLKELSA